MVRCSAAHRACDQYWCVDWNILAQKHDPNMNSTGQLFSCKVSLQPQLVSRLEDPSKKLGYRHTTETYERCWPGVQLHNVPTTTTGEWIAISFIDIEAQLRHIKVVGQIFSCTVCL